jgi:hypothetical protein
MEHLLISYDYNRALGIDTRLYYLTSTVDVNENYLLNISHMLPIEVTILSKCLIVIKK